MSQTKAQLVVGLNVNASAPASALQIDASGNINLDSNTLYVDAANNRVGVGTSSPDANLHVVGTSGSGYIQIGNGASDTQYHYINFGGSSSSHNAWQIGRSPSGGIGPANGFYIYDLKNSTARLVVDSSGKVGIGSTTPGSPLHVTGSGIIAQFLNTQNSTGEGIGLGAGTNIGRITSNGAACNLVFEINGTERARLDTSGRFGIGVTPSYKLHVDNGTTTDAAYLGNGYGGLVFGCNSSGERIINTNASGPIVFQRGGTETARIDGSSRLLVGTSSVISNNYGGTAGLLQVAKNDYLPIGFFTYNNNVGETGYCPYIELNRARGTQASPTAVDSGDDLGLINFYGHDGSNFTRAATIKCVVDGATGAGDMPGRLVFSTTADGASSPTERIRINNVGGLKVYSDGAAAVTSSTNSAHELTTDRNGGEALFVTNRNSVSPVGMQVYYSTDVNNTANYFFTCYGTSNLRAGFRSNGGLANYQANDVNLSDRNVKKDISLAAGTWDCIKEWEIVNYRYKDQPDDADLNLGVIAQQVAESCPEVITVFQEAKEAKPAVFDDDGNEVEPAQEAQPEKLGVKEQQMYWMAIKALQEAQLRIEQLEQTQDRLLQILNDNGLMS